MTSTISPPHPIPFHHISVNPIGSCFCPASETLLQPAFHRTALRNTMHHSFTSGCPPVLVLANVGPWHQRRADLLHHDIPCMHQMTSSVFLSYLKSFVSDFWARQRLKGHVSYVWDVWFKITIYYIWQNPGVHEQEMGTVLWHNELIVNCSQLDGEVLSCKNTQCDHNKDSHSCQYYVLRSLFLTAIKCYDL